MSATITVPLALLEQISTALSAAINTTVAVQDLCGKNDDGLPSGCVYAIAVCIEKQEDLICPAAEALWSVLEAAAPSQGQRTDSVRD